MPATWSGLLAVPLVSASYRHVEIAVGHDGAAHVAEQIRFHGQIRIRARYRTNLAARVVQFVCEDIELAARGQLTAVLHCCLGLLEAQHAARADSAARIVEPLRNVQVDVATGNGRIALVAERSLAALPKGFERGWR